MDYVTLIITVFAGTIVGNIISAFIMRALDRRRETKGE